MFINLLLENCHHFKAHYGSIGNTRKHTLCLTLKPRTNSMKTPHHYTKANEYICVCLLLFLNEEKKSQQKHMV